MEQIVHAKLKILDSKPYKQKQRKNNPSLEQIIKAKLDKMEAARVTYLVHYLQWVSNLVPIRKKIGDIQLYIDFQHPNKVSLKGKCLIPPMEEILQ
jgi:hypothetical protein